MANIRGNVGIEYEPQYTFQIPGIWEEDNGKYKRKYWHIDRIRTTFIKNKKRYIFFYPYIFEFTPRLMNENWK